MKLPPDFFAHAVLAALLLTLAACEGEKPAPASAVPAAPAIDPVKQAQQAAELTAARDALARQALEIETRSALIDKQLAEMEQRLQQQENAALRAQLDALKQQNTALRGEADTARRHGQNLSQQLAATRIPAPAAPAVQLPAQADYSVFYDRLSPYGRWIDVRGHGLCFQPRLARTRTWRPYVDGSWTWSSYGWAWQSNEPFGWATYHYGRWLQLTTYGWLWVPGSQWAPAWVAWRQSNECVGWAPLPPEPGVCTAVRRDCDTRYGLGPASYTFIRTTHFTRPSYTSYCQPVSYNSSHFHQTVNVTQIVPCTGSGQTNLFMHHGGPPRVHIEQACHRPVQATQIDCVRPNQLPANPADHRPQRPLAPCIVELPAIAPGARPAVAFKAAESVERPVLADAFAGTAPALRSEIQQAIAEDRNRALIADTPRPMPAPNMPVLANQPASVVAPALVAETPVSSPAPISAPQTESVLPAAPAAISLPVSVSSPPAIETASAPASPPQPLFAPTVVNPAIPVANSPAAPPLPETVPAAPVPAIAATPQPAETAPALLPAEMPAATLPPTLPTALTEAPATVQTQTLPAQIPEPAAAQPVAATPPAAPAVEPTPAVPDTSAAQAAAMQAQQQAQAEETARQQAAMQQQAEAARAAAEQEAARQQAEATAMQQKAAEEAQRQAQMEAQRQAEEQARRAAEEAQRQAQMEAQRQAQMEAQRQAEEQARRAAEEAARRAAEEAANRPQPPQ